MRGKKVLLFLGGFMIIWLISIPIILAELGIEKSTKVALIIVYILVAIIIFIILANIESRVLKKEKIIADEKRRIAEEQRKADELAAQRARVEREERILSSPIRNLTPLQFEEFTALYFKKRGYTHIDLTPQSGDFGADILATNQEGKRVCIQCKLYSQPVGISAIQEIISARIYYHCDIAIVTVSSNGYTRQAKELANSAGVYLYMFDDIKHDFVQMA